LMVMHPALFVILVENLRTGMGRLYLEQISLILSWNTLLSVIFPLSLLVFFPSSLKAL
jgi:hypothetical protein